MIVYYKFENSSAVDYDKIYFDGLHISVANLKMKIYEKNKWEKKQNFELKVTNAQTRKG